MGQQQYYGDEYDQEQEEEVTGALVQTRANKKRAKDDAKLLANRIALLKLEEKKAWKKIQETKKKAEQVIKIRERNYEDKQRKEEIRRQREYEEQALAQQNAYLREQTRQNILNQNQNLIMKQQEEATRLKEERMRNEAIIRRQKEAEMIKNNNIKQMVR